MAKETILIVEDDAILALHLHDTLTELGYTALEPVATGKAAIAAVATHRPDLVLMDIELNGEIDGIVTSGKIRDAVDVPIVFLTGYSHYPLIEQAKATSPYGYLVKPVPERELMATIEISLYRHRLDRKLRESEERYRLLAENVSDVIWTIDTNLRYTYMSPSVTRLLGYSVKEATALSMEETVSPASLETALRVMAEAQAKEGTRLESQPTSVTLELELIRKDGSTVWTESTVTYLRDSHGRLTGYQGVSRDITERKRTEEALRESEERFRLAIHATEEGLWEWDIQTNREFFAPRWCEIIGYSFDDPELSHTYNSWASRIHPDDYDHVISAMNNHLEKGTRYDVDYRHRHKSGEYRWQNSKGQSVLDESGKPIKMVGCISDITERKKAEEEKHRMEERSRKVVEDIFRFIPEGVLVFSRKMELLRQNQTFRGLVSGYAKRLGFTEDELENLIMDKVKAGLRDNNIKEIRIARKHETGKQT